jgi:hypothetical protein
MRYTTANFLQGVTIKARQKEQVSGRIDAQGRNRWLMIGQCQMGKWMITIGWREIIHTLANRGATASH